MIDPALLRTFLSVAEAGGFTEAARRLGMGQSTVSQHVRRLEALVGCVLFERDTHSVRLTGDGETMTGFARGIMDQQDRALRYFARPGPRGRVRFGVCEDFLLGHAADVLSRFRGAHPDVDLELSVELSAVLHRRLAEGELDLIVAKRETGHGIRRDPLLWVGGPGLRPVSGEPLPLVVYPEPSVTRARALGTLRSHGIEWRIGCVSERLNGLRAAVQAGLGVALFAASLVPEGLHPVEGLPDPGAVTFVLDRRSGGTGDSAQALADAVLSSAWSRPGSAVRRVEHA
ncbi:LysR substrate-binding domain-containing protein [Actinokineospora sp. PR83]|uniref:LysR substrate-binding domain-containing protein n=1 Tax=Actinokineospora sp. PR83 TaxID=2884908 RepID=UPI0027DEB042|nr:LysR substrate-binding domain-containing protein [Actinokineospora sp. PR83]MCG8917168.1 LysR substrate-binding domain-containing protein [Actinokineospora sp. PR83]